MSNPRNLSEVKGTKELRPRSIGSEAARSVVTTKDGRKFELLPGKNRGEIAGTRLGDGASGVVKKAVDEKGSELAVKKVFDISDIDVLFQEYEALKKMGDQYAELVFVEYEKDSKACSRVYLFQELAKGKSASAVFIDFVDSYVATKDKQEGQIRLIMMIKMILSMIDLTKNMHQKGIIHRDLYPRNVVWDQESASGKIIDFGSSRFFESGESSAQNDQLRLKDFRCLLQMEYLRTVINSKKIADDNMTSFVTCLNNISDQIEDACSNDEVNINEMIDEVKDRLNKLLARLEPKVAAPQSSYAQTMRAIAGAGIQVSESKQGVQPDKKTQEAQASNTVVKSVEPQLQAEAPSKQLRC